MFNQNTLSTMKKTLLFLASVLVAMCMFTSCDNSPKQKENSVNVHGFTGLKPEHVYYAAQDNEDGTFSHTFMVSSYDFETTLSGIVSNPLSIMSLNIPSPNLMFFVNIESNSATLEDGTYEISNGDDAKANFYYLYLTEDLNASTLMSGNTDAFNMIEGKAGSIIVSTDKKDVRSIDFSGNSGNGTVEIYYKGEYKDGQKLIDLLERLSDLMENLPF